jgi:hypothetical protein
VNLITTIHEIITTTEDSAVENLTRYLKLGAATEEQIGKAVTQVWTEYDNCSIPRKTFLNNVSAARRLVGKFGTWNRAGDAVNAHNVAAKRASYSVQVLADKLAPVVKAEGSPAVKVTGKLAKAVTEGIITNAQALAIAAL